MKKSQLTSIKHIIDTASRDGELYQIYQKQRQSEDANQYFKALIDSEIKPYIHVLSYVKGKLILEATSNAWAAKLRYIKQDLLSRLRKEEYFMGLIGIECVIKSSYDTQVNESKAVAYKKSDDKTTAQKEAVKLSKETTSTLQTQINESTDPILSERLQKIIDRYGDHGGEMDRKPKE